MRRRAFTLIETMLSFSLLGMIIILVMNLFPSALASLRSGEERYTAANLADSVLERQVGLPFEQRPLGCHLELDPQTIDKVQYRTILDVTAADGDPVYLRAFRVTVTWTSRDQKRTLVRQLWVHRLPAHVPD